MSEFALNVEARKDVGKGASRRLRHADLVPGIIYGGEEAPVQITLDGKAVRKVLEAEAFYSSIVTLSVEGKAQQAILKDIQRHPAKGHAMHMDFLRVDATHEVTTTVPLHFINEETSVGVKAGGAVAHNLNEVEVRCLPADLPEFIEVDMAAVELGASLHLSDLVVPAGVTLVKLAHGEEHDLPVVSIAAARGGEEAEEAEGEE
ncbi:50S ribosomal protein L25/general stress protein Ctc [Sansalvadorimonas sp. 2012CJ34-2]|uniref:Large ribosomal subunit protein bL25 n=1 Tax=Parendozoicomonas callyspongiae TaxID=2942213 RepID=A0ABT0PG59_9GAMM|nr:50S ribosomal protein L25/general stress protein Ctc [Sansalvadorimonas sp. 2012CJ34-2]MCL6270345.1 50S ribosomal protein L25/general stress protein Ctc [Sansalvadorimonas sp. 2012CJ34-2]